MHDAVRQRLDAAILQRGTDDRFIDRQEEREILQLAVQLGLGGEDAKRLLAETCAARDYLQESAVVDALRAELTTDQTRHGRLTHDRFEAFAADVQQRLRGQRSLADCRKLLSEIVEDAGWPSQRRTGPLAWIAVARKALGL